MRTPARVVGFKTEVRTEYPIEALRESVINALVHRDWHSSNAILVRMFGSHIDILSPGELLRPLKITEIIKEDYIPLSRNKTIIEIFGKSGIMDKRGTGILRMNKFCDDWRLPKPEFLEQTGYFGIIFRNPDYYTKVPEIKVELNERQKKAISYVRNREKITNTEYQDINKTTKKSATRDLQNLVKKFIFIQKGITGKGVYYMINPAYKGDIRGHLRQVFVLEYYVKKHPLKPKLPKIIDTGNTVIVSLFSAKLEKVEIEIDMLKQVDASWRKVDARVVWFGKRNIIFYNKK